MFDINAGVEEWFFPVRTIGWQDLQDYVKKQES